MKAFIETSSTGEDVEHKHDLSNFDGGYGEQYDTYGRSGYDVYETNMNWGNPLTRSVSYGDDDVSRSICADPDPPRSSCMGPVDADPVQKTRSVMSYSAQPGESYNSYTRAAVGVQHSTLAVAQHSFDVAHQMPQKGFGIDFGGMKGLMAQPKQYRQMDKSIMFELEQDDDVSSDMGMMAEDDDAAPEFFRLDSTYECSTDSIPQTMAAVEDSLNDVAASQRGERCMKVSAFSWRLCKPGERYLSFTQVTPSQFEGQFCQEARLCDFMITTWTEGQNQIMLEFKNLSSGLDCKLAYDALKRELVTSLKTRKILNELYDNTFEPLAEMYFDGNDFEPISQAPEEGELKAIIQDRVQELGSANFVAKQRELTAEILCIAETHPELVAETPELGGILAGMLKKNARSDIQMSRTINRLMRALLAYRRFDEGIKGASDSTGKRIDVVKTLIQTAAGTKDDAWASDLFNTILALQRIGMAVEGRRANDAYGRIQERAEAYNRQ